MRQVNLVLVLACAFSGCHNAEGQQDAARQPRTPGGNTLAVVDPARNSSAAGDFKASHVIVANTAYYKAGPQQAQPPDGTFQAGTLVSLLKSAGSYSLVRTAGGIQAYVATDSLQVSNSKVNPDIIALAEGNNQFACDLYGRLRSEPGNLFFSTGSISTALAMTYAGARDKTATQMANVLHFDLPPDRVHPAFSAWMAGLQRKENGIEFAIANRLWGQAGYPFLPEFLQITREQYGAELGQVDFVQQTEATRRSINTWVEEHTNNKIKDLIPSGVLNHLTRLVLTNAIYFKGDWKTPFKEKATTNSPFHVSTAERVEVPMMYQKNDFRYGVIEDMQILELPYVGEDLTMLVLLPTQIEGLVSLERKLTQENLDKWLASLRKQEVDVFLPKFTLTSQFNLNDVLQALGMTSAFDPDQADFSGMIGKKELFISAVVHKAFVDVNEQGTEAAAATGVVVGVTSVQEPLIFRADHPFVFLIRESKTGSILFMGRMVNPKT